MIGKPLCTRTPSAAQDPGVGGSEKAFWHGDCELSEVEETGTEWLRPIGNMV